jgi:hypothetical protein
MPSRRRRSVPAIARHSVGLTLTVPEVIAHRLTRMWLAGIAPTQRDREEMYLMWAEKSAAFYESWHAMFLEMFRANLKLALSPMWLAGLGVAPRQASARLTAHGQRAALAILGAGLAPIHSRARANAKRLRRTHP